MVVSLPSLELRNGDTLNCVAECFRLIDCCGCCGGVLEGEPIWRREEAETNSLAKGVASLSATPSEVSMGVFSAVASGCPATSSCQAISSIEGGVVGVADVVGVVVIIAVVVAGSVSARRRSS